MVSRLIIGISGASGVIYGIRALQVLRDHQVETHLVMTRAAEMTIGYETDLHPKQVKEWADVVHGAQDIGASIASGGFQTLGMLVAPCSINSLSQIAYGATGNLLSRAADVQMKERRKLVLLVRETPLHLGHLRAMTQATEAGAIIMPPVPAFYTKPNSIEEMVDATVARALALFGIEVPSKRWGEEIIRGQNFA